ncbi:MAG: hypothetical protein K1X74_14245 [Pirellulales bacterium]|nr:hypothetical protein [Pirellulales bacterium]
MDASLARSSRFSVACALLAVLAAAPAARAYDYLPIPGRGTKLTRASDDFEDQKWTYVFNNPKASSELDNSSRPPMGGSTNGLWLEGPGRGHPDLIRRVTTPEGGLEGSTGALEIATLHAGVPGRVSNEAEQDDLFLNIGRSLGQSLYPSMSPSMVVRVFVPPVDEWQQRDGSHFAFRASAMGTRTKQVESRWGRSKTERKTEGYWPGLFFQLYEGHHRQDQEDHPYLLIRAGERGEDYYKLPIKQTGWWTLGMSFSPDGRVHYFAHPGTADLTSADHLASHFPYGFHCERIDELFFDIWNDSRSGQWSPKWIVDDVAVYQGSGGGVAQQPGTRGRR